MNPQLQLRDRKAPRLGPVPRLPNHVKGALPHTFVCAIGRHDHCDGFADARFTGSRVRCCCSCHAGSYIERTQG